MSVCVCVHLTAATREVLVGWVGLSYNVKYERRLISLSSLAVHLSVHASVVHSILFARSCSAVCRFVDASSSTLAICMQNSVS